MINDEIRHYLLSQRLDPRITVLRDDESLLEAGVMDSVGMLGLIAFLEKTYRISINEDELVPENFESVRAIVSYVNNKTTDVEVPKIG